MRTFEQCTQHTQLPSSIHLQKQFCSPNPGASLFHCHEPDATDNIYSDTPAIDGGETLVHIFVGLISYITDVFKAKDASAEFFLALSKIMFACAAHPPSLLLIMLLCTTVRGLPDIFVIAEFSSTNVRLSSNIKTMLRTITSLSSA